MIKNLKKVISTLAAVAILATSAAVSAVSFPDVDESASYAGAVDALTTLGIVNGDDNGKFNPENTVTRAEFAKMVVEALGAGNEAASSTDTDFVDAKGHWAAGYIEVGVAKEFINGYDETTFGPDDQVTYAQAVKMLVAAIGYETYASMQGGWPSGYLAYGSSLDIIAGVTGVSNDTALTRAQCAVLIYNTLKAPICKVDGYEQNYKGEWVPKLEEMNGVAKEWQTLLTSKHDAYVVRGRVMSVDKKEGTVQYRVEVAENFDGQYVVVPQTTTVNGQPTVTVPQGAVAAYEVPAYIGTTNAADMLYTYSEAIVQKDDDTSEYTLVSITPYGAAKTVEFAAKDIDSVGTMTTATPAPVITTPYTIDVKKENSNKTTTYKLASNAELFVNGESVAVAGTKTFAAQYAAAATILSDANLRGTVTLVDATVAGSTSTDGLYDYVMVDEYIAAQVSDVRVKNDEVTIVTDQSGVRINWSLVEEDTTSVAIFKDGVEISYEDVKEDDVILVKRDTTGDWYEVYVSDKTVSGTATGKSTTTGKEYLLVDGTKYEFDNVGDIATMDLNTDYVLSLDAMGYVYTYEQGETNKNVGVVVGIYTKAGEEYPTVRMIDGNGEIVTYEAKATTTIDSIVAQLGASAAYGDGVLSKAEVTTLGIQKAVIEYNLSSGKLVYKAQATAVNSSDAVAYKASTSKLGGYTIDETATKILDLDAYLHADGDVAVFDAANFEDEGDYKAWVYDRNNKTGVHGLVLLTEGTTSLKATSALAVVTASGSVTDVDGVACELITVARNGEEGIEVLVANPSDPFVSVASEGSVVMYTVGAEGYVEAGKLHKIFTPAADYAAMMSGILGETNFTAEAANTYIVDSGNDDAAGNDIYTIAGAITGDADVEIYYGPVYSASASVLELFKTQASGKSSINDTEAFTLAGANVYTFNYDAIAGEGMSVSVGGNVQKNTLYKNMFGSDTTMTNVDWSEMTNAMVDPMTALVRVNDGDVTDVIFFVAE